MGVRLTHFRHRQDVQNILSNIFQCKHWSYFEAFLSVSSCSNHMVKHYPIQTLKLIFVIIVAHHCVALLEIVVEEGRVGDVVNVIFQVLTKVLQNSVVAMVSEKQTKSHKFEFNSFNYLVSENRFNWILTA